MAIVDGRTPINNADATTSWVNSLGAAAGTLDNDTFVQGTGSVAFNLSNAIEGLLYNTGGAQDWSNNHFYIWFNCGVAGKLDTQAGGGVRVRFCGATISNYFEYYIAGKDTYSGGWVMFVVNIESARATAVTNGWTGGTPPATTAIQYVGIIGDTAGFMTKKQDNFWVDAMWRLPANTPGIRVEGQNAGPIDWTWDDIVSAADISDPTKGWGTCYRRNGIIFINTPFRFGANDATTHGFSDTNKIIAWENQPVATSLYGLEVIGGSGTQSFVAGNKQGSGDSATGNQGWVITAPSSAARWYFDADDANVDSAGLFGCNFIHASDFQIDDAQVEARSCLLNDVSLIAASNGIFARNTIVNANTADGVAFINTAGVDDIKNNAFSFSDGHAIEITATGTYTFVGNTFSGYGADDTNDAAIYNNSGGLVTLNISGGGNTPTIRNGASASTTINNTVTLKVTVVDKNTKPIPTAQVAIYKTSDNTQLMNQDTETVDRAVNPFVVGVKYIIVTVGTTDFTLIGASSNTVGVVFTATGIGSGTGTASNGIASVSNFNYISDTAIYVRVRKASAGETKYIPASTTGTITVSGFSVTITLTEDTNA